jgi:hypothetical protein
MTTKSRLTPKVARMTMTHFNFAFAWALLINLEELKVQNLVLEQERSLPTIDTRAKVLPEALSLMTLLKQQLWPNHYNGDDPTEGEASMSCVDEFSSAARRILQGLRPDRWPTV